jgi:hypothetical protein
MVERLGQVMGAEAVDHALAAGDVARKGRTATLLRGWAGAAPAQAAAWFDAQKPEVRKNLLGEFVAGLALGEPKRAIEVVQQYGKAEKESYIPWIVSNALQREGFRGTEQAFGAELGTFDSGSRIFQALATRRLEVGKMLGEPINNLDWLDGYLRPDSPVSANATQLLLDDAARRDAAGTARWLAERDQRLSPTQQKAAYVTVAQSYLSTAPDQFVNWIGQHAAHPQYDAMVQATASSLVQRGNEAAAQRMVENMQDEAVRTKLQAALMKQVQRMESARMRKAGDAGNNARPK